MKTTSSIRLGASEVTHASRAVVRTCPDSFRYAYRPFDNRWLYWEKERACLARPSPDYSPHLFEGNFCGHFSTEAAPGMVASTGDIKNGLLRSYGSECFLFSCWLRDDGLSASMAGGSQRRPNLSPAAQRYLERLGATVEDLFHHVLAVLHDPAYREANAGALRMEWPRIPLPGWPDGSGDGAADELAASAARGRSWPPCSTPTPPSPASPRHRCAPRSPP